VGKTARRCGAKHVSKSRHPSFGPLLEAEMWQKWTPLWRGAHFEVKMLKTDGFGPLFGFNCPFSWQALWILRFAKGEQKCAGFHTKT
jgi:hypothetical protein